MVIKQITVKPFHHEHINIINKTNDPFPINGRLIPSLRTGNGHSKKNCMNIKFPDDHLTWDDYIIIFLDFIDGKYIGHIRLMKDWNKLCFIENIAVCKDYRKNGVGHTLFTKAEEWPAKLILKKCLLKHRMNICLHADYILTKDETSWC